MADLSKLREALAKLDKHPLDWPLDAITGLIESARDVAAQADAQPAVAAVPEGWVMVPREPTPKMVAAGEAALYAFTATAVYGAMVYAAPAAPASEGVEARPRDEYHEDYGCVTWWRFPVDEPAWIGSPLDSEWTEGYYTHWTPHPSVPSNAAAKPGEVGR
jgi:hypothetical protein